MELRSTFVVILVVVVALLAQNAWAQCPSGGTVISAGQFEVVDNATEGVTMEGECSLKVIMDGTTIKRFVQDDTPDGESIFRVSFIINPNDLMFYGVGDERLHNILEAKGLDGDGVERVAFRVLFIHKKGIYYVKLKGQADRPDVVGINGQRKTANAFLQLDTDPAASHNVDVEWQAASADGVRDGILRLRADGGAWQSNTLETYGFGVDVARFGAVTAIKATTTGSYYLDDFQSYRTLSP